MNSSQQPVTLRTDMINSQDQQTEQFRQEAEEGRFSGIREYLAQTRESQEWEDRIYVLDRVGSKVSIDALDAACSAEPDSADLILIRCAYYGQLAKTMRGGGTADQVSGSRFQNAAECVRAAMNDMARASQLDEQDPTAYTLVLSPLTIFSQIELQQKAFNKAIAIAPNLVAAHLALVAPLSKRWGGSHEACLKFAREAMKKSTPGSDMAVCLFKAHWLVQSHSIHFDRDVQSAKKYAQNPSVSNELNAALENWLTPTYVPRRYSVPYLSHASNWYRIVMDVDRLKRVIAFTGEEIKLPEGIAGPTVSSGSKRNSGLLGWFFK